MGLPQPVRRWRRRGFYALVRALAATLRRLPIPVGRGVLRVLGGTAWILLGSERRVAREQIARAFPELPSDVRDGMGRRSLLRLGDNLLDMVRGDASVRFPEGERRKLTDLLASGPVLVLMAHSGAWELVGPVLVQATGRFGAVTAEPHNPWVGAWLRREREARGIRCFDRDREVAAAARWLSRGGCLAVLGDHRPRGGAVTAKWFGVPVASPTGPARLARIAGATILPLGIRRNGNGHVIGVGAPFVPVGDEKVDASRCNEALQELILASPEEWTWFHERND